MSFYLKKAGDTRMVKALIEIPGGHLRSEAAKCTDPKYPKYSPFDFIENGQKFERV